MLNIQSRFHEPFGWKPVRKISHTWPVQKYNNYITFYRPDINECALQEDPCDAVANCECNNTHRSYYCQYNDGFVKNGAICEGAI